MSYSTVDATAGGQNIRILVPDSGYTDKAIIYCHGAGESQNGITDDSLKTGCVNQLTSDGYLIAASNASGDNWGNQASLDAYAALRTYLISNYAPAKIALWSQSMGGCDGLLLASAGFSGLAGWLGTYPVCSLSNMFGGNAGTFAGSIRTAFGIASDGSDYSTKTSGYDPLLKSASTFLRLPMRFYASPSDTTVDKSANSDAMHTLVSPYASESTVVVCSGVHGDPSHFQPSDYSAFFARAFAYNRVPVSQFYYGAAA